MPNFRPATFAGNGFRRHNPIAYPVWPGQAPNPQPPRLDCEIRKYSHGCFGGPVGAGCDRHRQAWLLSGSAENDRQRRVPGGTPLAEQSGGKLPPAAQTARTGNAAISADEDSSEIRGHSFIRTQSFQSGAPFYRRENFKPNRAAAWGSGTARKINAKRRFIRTGDMLAISAIPREHRARPRP